MSQLPVISYQLQVSTNPPVMAGQPAPEFIPRILLQVQGLPRIVQLPINSPAEFAAACALIQAPGRLFFETEQETLEKVSP